ncbi:hypothetical protein SAMN06297144_0680 [Sphingomonas guangdongensis]|uniref:Uncharacterized protein n=1 Tax=Sphingomonas guangdongensis TaxID=1141890 RepID=A0A285QDV0_9SPHN|nr:hypothetical protein [Sphingomonas guangdongensis]SOB79688.1 hypothetical protein SAMN06297144_0680 [Sphingomonas guangdongensis]
MKDQPLATLQTEFRAGSTASMPIAGAIVWAALGAAALVLDDGTVGTLALYIMAAIMPLAILLDRVQGRNLFAGGADNPLTVLFLTSVTGIALMVPIGVIAAQATGSGVLMVLTMAILAGVIWIPYGWAADDPAGLRHAVGRALGAYAAYALVPAPYTASGICAVVVAAYGYSLVAMRPVGTAVPA